MRIFTPTRLTWSLVFAMRADPPFVRLGRDGLDEATERHLARLLGAPVMTPLATRVADRGVTFQGLMEFALELSDPRTGLSHGELDVENALVEIRRHDEPDAVTARAITAILILAALEGLARRYRPDADYPYLSVASFHSTCLPLARLLPPAGLHGGAATVATLVRHYIMCDPGQRGTDAGRQTMAECREIEAEHARRLRICCEQTAWLLHGRFGEPTMRLCVAALFFALGDVLRARAIMVTGHVPSRSVLVDLVEVSVELAAADPLLQAVWLVTLGETEVDVPDEVRFILRLISPEVYGAFKGADAGAKNVFGMSISDAYAEVLLHYVGGLWDRVVDTKGWKVLVGALRLPVPIVTEYRSGFTRVLELYSLATEPGTALPQSEFVSDLSGAGPVERSDLREVAALLLRTDQWTARRGQLGRSLAYDSAFLVEPWRRGEGAAMSLEVLEVHRHASLDYWLTVVPPLTPRPRSRRERRAVREDRLLMREYRSLAFLATMTEAPLYVRVYGNPIGQRVIDVAENDRRMRLMDCDKRRKRWYEETARFWPEYAQARVSSPATLDEIGAILGLT
jgi:hypothetical protein